MNELIQDGVGEPDGLERLWTPYRMAYIRGENKPADDSAGECPFCRIPRLDDDQGLVVRRGRVAYAVLNLYPYTRASISSSTRSRKDATTASLYSGPSSS